MTPITWTLTVLGIWLALSLIAGAAAAMLFMGVGRG